MKPTAPAEINDLVVRFARVALKGVAQWIDVEPLESSKEDECFDNVDLEIRVNGGKAIMGWIVREKPDVWLEAEHHAVWEQADGTWREVTPTVDCETRLVFVRDDKGCLPIPALACPHDILQFQKTRWP
jgi:hypothetical protein